MPQQKQQQQPPPAAAGALSLPLRLLLAVVVAVGNSAANAYPTILPLKDCPINKKLTISFTTDDYPEGHKWWLYDEQKNTILSSHQCYATGNCSTPKYDKKRTTYEKSICLAGFFAQSYTFRLYDEFNDGICLYENSNLGPCGSIKIFLGDGTILYNTLEDNDAFEGNWDHDNNNRIEFTIEKSGDVDDDIVLDQSDDDYDYDYDYEYDTATEKQTEFPTEFPTDFPTDFPTEFPTEVPTETPTFVVPLCTNKSDYHMHLWQNMTENFANGIKVTVMTKNDDGSWVKNKTSVSKQQDFCFTKDACSKFKLISSTNKESGMNKAAGTHLSIDGVEQMAVPKEMSKKLNCLMFIGDPCNGKATRCKTKKGYAVPLK